jgi:hypothetical protein
MSLVLHIDLDSEAQLTDLARLDTGGRKVALRVAGEARTFAASAGPVAWRPSPARSASMELLAPARLAEIVRIGQPALIVGPGVRLAPHALDYVAAVTARDLGASLASLFAPPRRRAGGAPFTPLLDGGDNLFAAIDPGPAVVVTPDQARRLLAAPVGGPLEVLFPRTGMASSADGAFDPTIEHGPREWRFLARDQSLAVHDQDLEITPAALRRAAPGLPDVEFAVDLLGERASCPAPYLLSARPCAAPIRTFGLDLTPLAANIAFEVPGAVFSLGPAQAFGPMTPGRRGALVRHLDRAFDLREYVGQLLGAKPAGRRQAPIR